MKPICLPLITLFLSFAQPILNAQAVVVKNPVDLTQPAEQNSGADYGNNVVTRQQKGATAQPVDSAVSHPTLHTTVDSETGNDETTMARANIADAKLTNPSHASETTVMTERDQQAQMEPTHGPAAGWFIALLAVLIVGGVWYVARKRDPHLDTNRRV